MKIMKQMMALCLAVMLMVVSFCHTNVSAGEIPVSSIELYPAATSVGAGAAVRLEGEVVVATDIQTVNAVASLTDLGESTKDRRWDVTFTVTDSTGVELPIWEIVLRHENNGWSYDCYNIHEIQIPQGSTIHFQLERFGNKAPIQIELYLNEVKVYQVVAEPVPEGEKPTLMSEWSILDDAKQKLGQGQYLDTLDHWAKGHIEKSVVNCGVNYQANEVSKLFRPDASMTRAVFLESLAKMAGEDVDLEVKTSRFADVPAAHACMPYIEWAYKNRIIYGTSETTFNPDGAITRQDLATILNSYFAYKGITLPTVLANPKTFVDEKEISDYARANVLALQKAAIMQGYPDGSYGPKKPISRGEAATVLWLLYEKGIIE